eukprot:COSAG06_NODE_1659_length_8780_cov_82.087663_3_plen_122_part_00
MQRSTIALRQAPHRHHERIIADSCVTAQVIKAKLEAGVTGDAAIVGLEYAEGSSGPESIVLKYAKSLAANRALAQDTNMYEKETFFYMELHGYGMAAAHPPLAAFQRADRSSSASAAYSLL